MMTLKFFVKENDTDFPLSQMSEPETFAISECVRTLLPVSEEEDCWFEPDVCVFVRDEEEEPAYGLVRYYQENPNPKDYSLAESRIAKEIPQTVIDSLQGKTFRVKPKRYGVNPWGKKVEITFESVKPVNGMKASELISLALKVK